MGRGHGEGTDGLVGREPSQMRYVQLDDEGASRLEMGGDVLEARHFRVLRGEVGEAVAHQVGEA